MPDTCAGAAGTGLPDDDKRIEPHTFRLPIGMKALLKARALSTRRTLNAEVVVILERALAEGQASAQASTLSYSVPIFSRD